MRERFDAEYIRSELDQVGDRLESSVAVYLIGGGSMAFRDLKETTKDIDLVVTDGDALRRVQAVLLDRGYEVVREPGEEYDELGTERILENGDGCRIDVFNRQVVDRLVLSEGMRERSVTRLEVGKLTVALVSSEGRRRLGRLPRDRRTDRGTRGRVDKPLLVGAGINDTLALTGVGWVVGLLVGLAGFGAIVREWLSDDARTGDGGGVAAAVDAVARGAGTGAVAGSPTCVRRPRECPQVRRSNRRRDTPGGRRAPSPV